MISNLRKLVKEYNESKQKKEDDQNSKNYFKCEDFYIKSLQFILDECAKKAKKGETQLSILFCEASLLDRFFATKYPLSHDYDVVCYNLNKKLKTFRPNNECYRTFPQEYVCNKLEMYFRNEGFLVRAYSGCDLFPKAIKYNSLSIDWS